MSEYHDTGLSKQEHYRISRNQVNSDFDKQLKTKSIFTSKSSIEAEREQALNKVQDQYYGGRSVGGFCE